MSTDLYRVEIEDVSDALTMRLVIGDATSATLLTSKYWALMLLAESTSCDVEKEKAATRKRRQSSALRKALFEEAGSPPGDFYFAGLEEAFWATNGAKYVAKVALLEQHHVPTSEEEQFAYNREKRSEDPKRAAWGRYTIVPTDKRWIAHLYPGMIWSSTSYGPARDP